MAKKAFFKGEKFIFSRVKGSAETDYREGDINITPANLGLGSVNNTADKDKPVSTAQQKAIDVAYANSNKYTDQKIADLINGAPETMDTLKEVSDAISASKSTEEALNKSIGTKANQTELDTHTGNDTIHITASEREKWNKNGGVTGVRGSEETEYKTGQVTISAENIGAATTNHTHAVATQSNNGFLSYDDKKKIDNLSSTYLMLNGDTESNVVSFSSGDSSTPDYTPPSTILSGETHASLFNKISTAVKNVRWLLSKMGTTDISAIGNGTVTGALSTLNSNMTGLRKTQLLNRTLSALSSGDISLNDDLVNYSYYEIIYSPDFQSDTRRSSGLIPVTSPTEVISVTPNAAGKGVLIFTRSYTPNGNKISVGVGYYYAALNSKGENYSGCNVVTRVYGYA